MGITLYYKSSAISLLLLWKGPVTSGTSNARAGSAVLPVPQCSSVQRDCQRWTGAGQELTKRLPEPWRLGFLPAGESSYLPEDAIPITESCPDTSVTRRCQVLILFYCTEVSKPSHLLCLSIKGALFFMGHSHPWDVSVFLQHFQVKACWVSFFFFDPPENLPLLYWVEITREFYIQAAVISAALISTLFANSLYSLLYL